MNYRDIISDLMQSMQTGITDLKKAQLDLSECKCDCERSRQVRIGLNTAIQFEERALQRARAGLDT